VQRTRLVALGALAIGLACTTTHTQVVHGIVTRDGRPAASERLVLAAGERCAYGIGEFVTDDSGSFEMSHEVARGTFFVVVQRLALCRAGARAPLWSTLWGPAPSRVELRCELGSASCTVEKEY
jgi:hypothetical protein